MSKNEMGSNAPYVAPDALIYHFGILTSSTHIAWLRTVAGRLKSRFRYSAQVVYNNFPWPQPSKAQQQKIEQTVQKILNVRGAIYPDATFADLYDEVIMSADLRKVHKRTDRAVAAAYAPEKLLDDKPAVVITLLKFTRF